MEDIIGYILVGIAYLGPIFIIVFAFASREWDYKKGKDELERARIIKKLGGDDTPYAIWKCKIASNEKDFRKFTMIRALLIAITAAIGEVFLIYQTIKYAVSVGII